MKKNIGFIILIVLMCGITAFLAFIVVSKQGINNNNKFNYKEGQVLKFEDGEIKAKILNIASTLCDNKDTCISPGEIELSVQIEYKENITNYTLKTVSNSTERIKKSNYYLNLTYEDKKLNLDVTEK